MHLWHILSYILVIRKIYFKNQYLSHPYLSLVLFGFFLDGQMLGKIWKFNDSFIQTKSFSYSLGIFFFSPYHCLRKRHIGNGLIKILMRIKESGRVIVSNKYKIKKYVLKTKYVCVKDLKFIHPSQNKPFSLCKKFSSFSSLIR